VLYIIKESIYELRDKTGPKEGLYVIIRVVVIRGPVTPVKVENTNNIALKSSYNT
jgi:hypothetical protein